MRAIGRVSGASLNTITSCSVTPLTRLTYHASKVRGIKGFRHIQCDEIWGFVYANKLPYLAKSAPDHAGDIWVHGPGYR